MKNKTKENVYTAFIGEAKLYFRLLAYAEKADEEDIPQIALLFRAIAEAEKVHAVHNLNLVRDILVKDTDTNLRKSFKREKSVSEMDPKTLFLALKCAIYGFQVRKIRPITMLHPHGSARY